VRQPHLMMRKAPLGLRITAGSVLQLALGVGCQLCECCGYWQPE
jgi:hypothetical protein